MPVLVTGIHAVGQETKASGGTRPFVQNSDAVAQPNRVVARDKHGHDAKA
jgi:hypothetical protein